MEKSDHPAFQDSREPSFSVIRVLGLSFFQGTDAEAIDLLAKGGLAVFPSGPGLADDWVTKPNYREALLNADFVFPDSGLMVIIHNLLARGKPALFRYSGLKLLRDLFATRRLTAAGTSFWVMPSPEETARTLAWLAQDGICSITSANCYLAPFYRKNLGADAAVEDPALLKLLEENRPHYVFLNVGSGVQEQLGWYLKQNLTYRPAILCTGAALAFLTGGQATIPPWADRLYLGWLLRIFQDPRQFGKRYFSALKLVPLMLKEQNPSSQT